MVARTLLRSSFNCIKTKWSVWSSSFVSHQWILLPGHFWECIKQKSHVLDPTQYSKPNLLCRCIVALILQQGVLMCLRTGPFFFHYSKCIFSQNEDWGCSSVVEHLSACTRLWTQPQENYLCQRERKKRKRLRQNMAFTFLVSSDYFCYNMLPQLRIQS